MEIGVPAQVPRACTAAAVTTSGSRSPRWTTPRACRWPDLIGQSELGPDEAGWRERADEIDKLISDWTARRSVTEAVDALRACGVAGGAASPQPRRC